MGCELSSTDKLTQPHKTTIRHKRTKLIDARNLSTKYSNSITQNVSVIGQKLNKQQMRFAYKCLSEHQFFSSLKQNQLNQIIKGMVIADAKKDQYIFKQGDTGNNFFIIYEGSVDVEINKNHIRTLNQSKTFGQLALLFRTQRTASITAKSNRNVFLILKPACFRDSLKKMKIYQFQKLGQMVDNVQIFQGLTNKQKQLISQNLKTIQFKKNQIIFNTGDLAHSFYIISSGQIKIQIQGKQPLILKNLDSFGQNVFKQGSKRVGKAIAIQDSVCCYLDKMDLQNIFDKKFDNIFHYNLKKWALLRSQKLKLDHFTINYLIKKFQIRQAKQGEVLFSKVPTGIIINLQGLMNDQPQGTLFCEQNLIDRTVLQNPIIKTTAGAYAFITFDNLQKNISEALQLKKNQTFQNRDVALQKQNIYKPNLNQFRYLKELGSGQFGKVYLVKNNQNGGKYFALKCLSKHEIQKQAMQKCVIQQKRILAKIAFPYIVGYANSFHDQKNVYILMQYIKGKQMFDVIRQMQMLGKKIASYFFGCILLAIQHLHEHNIIYRDIKPQNSVVDHTGKAFLIDLGTAKVLKKQNSYKTFTMLGTPHYMAPQIMDGKGYSFQVDIWSLGILLYEFVAGGLPFGQDENDPYAVMKIIKSQQIKYPSSVGPDLKQLLNLLLQKNFIVRSIKATFSKIKESKYFSDMNWKDLLAEKVAKPYVPRQFRKQHEHEKTAFLDGKPLGQFLYGKNNASKQWNVRQWNQEFNFIKEVKDNKNIINESVHTPPKKQPFGQNYVNLIKN